MTHHPRFLVVTYPAQGHINPALQFAKRLAGTGADVTFVTTHSAHCKIANGSPPTIPNGSSISHAPFSDGYEDGFKPGDDVVHYHSELRRRGSQAISDLVVSAASEGRPYTCLVYTLLLPWAALVAEELRIPPILLWIQPAVVFDIYYNYFHGYGDIITENSTKDPSSEESRTTLPGLPWKFTRRDLPSFMDAANTYSFVMPLFKDQFEIFDCKIKNLKILINTFDELEPEALKAIGEIKMIGIGPLIPSAFLDEKDPSDTSFGGDLFPCSKDEDQNYIEWLNSKPEGSVVYVSFGSIAVLSRAQMEEIGKGLLDSGRPFLWVIREKAKKDDGEGEKLSCQEELEKVGKIVPWCCQVEVLSNSSLGCFVTHCGWNSTLESLVCGVPVVAFPQWSDQGTNAKLIEDVWGTGVRVRPDEKGMVGSEEIKRCLEIVMQGNGLMRSNAKKWKDLAREAAKEGGSSDRNLKEFVADVVRGDHHIFLD
ncbi:hypothetical protein TIFTF001_042086 [Ficus carica]|uniref:Glycosyltransferase n=1 Tax=Ficus carica TaxID=3494 RepID=A0AA88CYG0_FICCA|nr:hypothetical protein TIFTF001_042086 [Ficus carica]